MDGLERDLGDSAQVLRISVTDDVGAQLAARYGVRGVPTFVLLGGDGEVMLQQAGTPQRDQIKAALGLASGG